MGARQGDNKKKRKPEPRGVGKVLGRILPVLAAVGAFVAIVLIYRIAFPWIANRDSGETAASAEAGAVAATTQDQAAYRGVSDVWTGGVFTTGTEELDLQVKTFCDALTDVSMGAKANAQNVYNNIVQSTYAYRSEDQQVSGEGWDTAVAKHYFSTGSPEYGIGGEGDAYEFAAATALCLRYFGYSDAIAIPVYNEEYDYHGAVCLVTDENGYSRLCDPMYGMDGWMIDRSVFPIKVENIGQDLSYVDALGLTMAQTPTEGESETTAATTEDTYSYDY